MEHYYQTIGENWFSYAEFYKDIVNKLPNNSLIVELGCWKGRSTSCLGVEIVNSQKDITLYCVDSWKYFEQTEQPTSSQEDFDKVYEEFLNNIKPFAYTTNVIRKESKDAASLFFNEMLDFVFIDANHSYEGVKIDIESWLSKVKKGGIIAGHDYFTRVHPGVKQAVDELFIQDELTFIPEQNVWMVVKK